ncbi:MAG TPA: twin-arginine translocase TatA/TatE family subunit [Gammaproteobacteria bacterium]|nr:twin-arginine translocase TatA/TatE family subunit [Gammaproteobacteria bacterium]
MGISVWQLLILLAVVILIFGTKKLKNVGGDLGSAIKSFKSAVKTGDDEGSQQNKVEQATDNTAKSESVKKEDNV